MKRKTWYWIAAVVILVVLAILIWIAVRPAPAAAPPADGAGGAAEDPNVHDHGQHAPTEPSDGDPELQAYLEEQAAIMDGMMTEMAAVEPSGSAAADFLAGMIPHHASAIAMADSYLQHGGTHAVLQPLAEDVIRTQAEEIDRMEAMLADLQKGGDTDQAQADAYWADYDAMMAGHHAVHAAPAAGSLDAAFAEGMLVHHQMAVDMAKAVLDRTGDADVQALAQAIIDAQEREIADMQAVLDDLAAP